MWQLIAGIVVGVMAFGGIQRISLLGFECLYISGTQTGPNGPMCINPLLVYAIYALALALIAWGVVTLIRANSSPKAPLIGLPFHCPQHRESKTWLIRP